MRIIILNQFFYPDHSATSQLMTDLADGLVRRGLAVTALSGRGRYNGGEKLPPKEVVNGVTIERAWATGFGKGHLVGRLLDYFSFYLGASWKLLRLPRHDIVMALTTPPLIGLVAVLIGKLRRMRVIALVQDIYPDVAVALGAIKKEGLVTRLLDRLNRFTLTHSHRVIVLGDCMRDRVLEKLGNNEAGRLDVIHNWADGAQITPLGEEPNPFLAEQQLESKFVVLFSGNLGHVNEFATVLEAARQLRDRDDIVFLFIGEGARRTEIESFVAEYKLTNIRLLRYQKRESLRYSLAAGDVHLVTLAPGLAGLSVPSKTYAILAAARPFVFVGDLASAAARIACDNDCGAAIAAGQSQQLAQLLAEWAEDKRKLAAYGANARSLFEAQFDKDKAIAAYLASFAKCLKDGTAEWPGVSEPLSRNAPSSEPFRAER